MKTIRGYYLLDKTGESDHDVHELEEILGTLRQQPRPLDIPAGLQVGRERNFFRRFAPRLAIAATIAMLLLGLGLWLGLQRLQRTQPAQLVKNPDPTTATPNPVNESTPKQDQNAVVVPIDKPTPQQIVGPSRRKIDRSQLASNTKRVRDNRERDQQLTAARRQEAEAAKNHLMLAFRMVSAKLNFAQKKAQELNQKEPAHNQHKIG
jgi:hypothetical protein